MPVELRVGAAVLQLGVPLAVGHQQVRAARPLVRAAGAGLAAPQVRHALVAVRRRRRGLHLGRGPLPLQLVGPLPLLGRGDGHRGHDLRVRVVRVEGEGVAATHVQPHHLARPDALEHGDHVVVGEAQHARPVHVDQHVPGLELAVQPRGAVGHDGLDLEELLLAVVAAHDGEAQTLGGLD